MFMVGSFAHCCVLFALLICASVASETRNSTAISVGFETLQDDQVGVHGSQRVKTTANNVNGDKESRGFVETNKELAEIGGEIAESATTLAANVARWAGIDETAYLATDIGQQSSLISSIEQNLRNALSSPRLTAELTEEDYQAIIEELIESHGDFERNTILALYNLSHDPTTSQDFINRLQHLETELLKWWRIKGKSSDDVYSLLELDLTHEGDFQSPLFLAWKNFITFFWDNPASVLATKIFSENSNRPSFLAKIIELHLEGPEAEVLKELLFQKWNWSGVSVSQVFTDLGLTKEWILKIDKPELSVWLKYAASKGDPWQALYRAICVEEKERLTVAEFIHQAPPSEYQEALENAQFRFWYDESTNRQLFFNVHAMLAKDGEEIEKDSLAMEIWLKYSKYLRVLKGKEPMTDGGR